MQVPFLDLRTQYQSLSEELLPAMTKVMAKGAFVGGPALAEFEAEFARFCEAEWAVGVGNGTDALQLACRAAGIGPGDEVITAANTFVATVEAITLTGATPVLVDMDPVSYHFDIGKIEDAITPRTKALMPVHLYGDPVDMDPVLEIARRRSLLLIEDAAQAHGARYKGKTCGSFGDMAGFSFYPGKNLGAYGDGGAVTGARPEFAAKIRQLGDHGSPAKFQHVFLGTNSRLDALQAVVLHTKLARLEEWNRQRRRIAQGYAARLGDLQWLQLPAIRPEHEPVFHLYVVRSPYVERIAEALKAAEIGFGYHYPVPVHLQPAFKDLGDPGAFPEAEAGAKEIISLPMFPEMSDSQLDHVAEALRGTKI